MGGNLDEIDRWRNEIEAGTLLGPRIKRSGPFIDGPKKMNLLRKSFTKIPANEEAARSLVDSLKTAGVDFLKVHSRLPRSIFLRWPTRQNLNISHLLCMFQKIFCQKKPCPRDQEA